VSKSWVIFLCQW